MHVQYNVVTKVRTTSPGTEIVGNLPSLDIEDESETADAIIEDTASSFIGQLNPRVIQRLIDEVDILNGKT